MIDTVIFDLDGTLLYTLENLHKSVNFALDKYGYPVHSLDDIRNFVGNGVQKLMERCLTDGINNPDFTNCLDVFKEHYNKTMQEYTKPYDGIIELLGLLNKENIKCAVVSNKYDDAVKQLCKNYFGEKIVSAQGESTNVRKKPAPDSVLKIIRELQSQKAVFVGDSEVDIQTALNAKIPCISVTWGYKDKDFLLKNGAKILADNTDELYTAIKNL